MGDTISILFSGGLLCLSWEGCGPQEQHLVQETGGQSGSEVTTPANIHLHPRGGLRVRYCSRGNTGLFKCVFLNQTFYILTKEIVTFSTFSGPKIHAHSLISLCCKINVEFVISTLELVDICIWRWWCWLKKKQRKSNSSLCKVSVPVWWPCPWCWSQHRPLSTCCTSAGRSPAIFPANLHVTYFMRCVNKGFTFHIKCVIPYAF